MTRQLATKLFFGWAIVLLAAQTVFIVWYYLAAFKPHCL